MWELVGCVIMRRRSFEIAGVLGAANGDWGFVSWWLCSARWGMRRVREWEGALVCV